MILLRPPDRMREPSNRWWGIALARGLGPPARSVNLTLHEQEVVGSTLAGSTNDTEPFVASGGERSVSYLSGDHDTVSLSYSWLTRQEGCQGIGLSIASRFTMEGDR